MKRILTFFVLSAGFIALCAAQVPSAISYRQEGIASWYGNEFDGRKTASGEIFDSTIYTAAHPSLPFQTVLTVTNIYNNKKVRVRINDRGPFVTGRIIDLSRAAAEVLDMVSTGTAMVVIESTTETALGPVGAAEKSLQLAAIYPPLPIGSSSVAPAFTVIPETADEKAAAADVPVTDIPLAPVDTFVFTLPEQAVKGFLTEAAKPAARVEAAPALPQAAVSNTAGSITMGPEGIKGNFPPAGNGKTYRLQVGAYKVPANAVEAYEKLKNAGFSPDYDRSGDTEMYRVVLTGLPSGDMPRAAERLYSAGFTEVYFREER
jgi:rare lipoprotein A